MPYKRTRNLDPNFRYCSSCKETKPIAAFGKNKAMRGGVSFICNFCIKSRQLLGKYGLFTEAQFLDMLSAQNNKCAICKRPFLAMKDVCIDHDHVTGEVRGLLHAKCNSGLGMYEDNEEFLFNAILYLRQANRLKQSPLYLPSINRPPERPLEI